MENRRELRRIISNIPVIDTHEHYTGQTTSLDNVFSLFNGYDYSEFLSSSFSEDEKENCFKLINDQTLSFDEKYEIFAPLYKRTQHTGYLRGTKRGLKEVYGIDDINKESLASLSTPLMNRNQEMYEFLRDKYKIKETIVDCVSSSTFIDIIEGRLPYTKNCKFAFTLPDFHTHVHCRDDIVKLQKYLGRSITCLDDYMEAFENLLKKAVEFGIVCIKDQSAYNRKIDFGFPSKAQAENVFMKLISNKYKIYGTDETKDFSDWFINQVFRLAAKYHIPVQSHTGHMARIHDEIEKTNAIHLQRVLNVHTDVKFSLFHGNWPYMNEYLFLGKNNSNVYLDLCWVQCIDPLYTIELIKRAINCLPQNKLMAFGGDTTYIELTIGYLELARDNVTLALEQLINQGFIDIKQAESLAWDMFYNNPKNFFGI